jgi:hypothetical protein
MGNNLLNWFLRNIVLPKYKLIKHPNFIIINFKDFRGKEIYFRQVLFPENILIEIENILEKANNTKLLYNIGVTLGYNFAKLFGVPNVKNNSQKEVDNYSRFTFKWNFSTWCKDANLTYFNIDERKVDIEFDEHIICRKNGKGYILTEGAQAGFGKYLFCDNNIEAVQIKCQGRKDENCKTIWRTKKDLKKEKIDFKEGKVLYEINDFSKEKQFNLIQPAKYSKKSTYNMIKSNIFNLKDGHINFKNQVFFDCTVILYYLIELYLSKEKKILFDIGFKYGSKISKGEKLDFIPDILSALGFGDTLITKSNNKIWVNITYFPWSCLINEKIEFNLFKGILSGMLSNALKRDVIIKESKKIMKNEYLIMQFFES